MLTEDPSALLDQETHDAISIDRTKGDFTFPERHKYDAGRGLSAKTVDYICDVKQDPQWVREFRHKALDVFNAKPMPTNWATKDLENIHFDEIRYYLSDGEKPKRSWDDVPEDVLRTFERLGIPEQERAFLAGVEAQYDSEAAYSNMKEELTKQGVIFVNSTEGLKEYEEIFRPWFGKVIPTSDNKFSALNSAVFSGGSFIYIPKGVKLKQPLQAYFRINSESFGQFERTLIIADEGAEVMYMEGCTAPMRDENQLHAAVVELVALDDARIKYSTIQNWYPGDAEGRGGIYNFVTKRGKCLGRRAHISWTQVETGSAITWKYPSCILLGDDSVGEFYSVALTKGRQQADTGTKMLHIGRNTRSTIVSKGISAGHGQNTYRGQVRINRGAAHARNFTQCDSLLIGDRCGAHTIPYIEVKHPSAQVEHEATTSKISEDQKFYAMSRGLSAEEAVALIVNGFCREVLQTLPMEFAVEAQKLLGISLEGSVG